MFVCTCGFRLHTRKNMRKGSRGRNSQGRKRKKRGNDKQRKGEYSEEQRKKGGEGSAGEYLCGWGFPARKNVRKGTKGEKREKRVQWKPKERRTEKKKVEKASVSGTSAGGVTCFCECEMLEGGK